MGDMQMGQPAVLPVQDIADLGRRVLKEQSALQSTLASLRAACACPPNFTGHTATSYETFLSQWDRSQQGLLTAMLDAGQLLERFAANLLEADTGTNV